LTYYIFSVLDYDNVTINESSEDECESEKGEEDKHNSHYTLPEIGTIINYVKKSIYDALFHYFDSPPKFALLASLLDSRFKKMRGWPNEVRETAISLLKEEYQLLKSEEAATPQETNMMHSYPIGGFKSRLFGLDEKDESDDELNCYLDNIRTPQAPSETDPFQWWIDNEQRFPTLFKIARKYLGVPATSVPSE
jgi:hypothetical protein